MEYPQDATKNGSLGRSLLKKLVYIGSMGIDVAGIGLTLLALGWLLLGEGHLPTWHFSSLLPGIITLSPIIAILGLFARRRWFAFHLAPTVLFIVLYGGQFIPRAPIVAEDTPQLRVMAFNTRYRSDAADLIAEQILSADADVVALQELSTTAADYFATYLADEYPYQISHTDGNSVRGKGLLSRYPLRNDNLQVLEHYALILEAEFDFDGQPIHIISIHPSSPNYGIAFNSTPRSRQLDSILKHLEDVTIPVIFVGDFNATDQSDDYYKVAERYTDSFREVGFGLGQTFPDGGGYYSKHLIPLVIRIDYIFHSENLQAVTSQVWQNSGTSDHRPVVTDFIWR